MIGQKRALIPVAIGIALLLTGISGYLVTPGEKQATAIAEHYAVTTSKQEPLDLTGQFRADADAAARQTGAEIAADLRGELRRKSEMLAAEAPQRIRERG